ncbi:MAG: hypothetical protein AAFQ10_02665 [Pseudomonadota bacterium]
MESFLNEFGSSSLAFVTAVVAGAGLPYAVARRSQSEKRVEIAVLLISLAVVGAVAGVLGGMSRVGVVGDITAAFLGIIGAAAAFLFGIDRSRGLIGSFSAVALALSLGIGFFGGAKARLIPEDHRALRSACVKAFSDADLLSNETAYRRFHAVLSGPCSRAMTWHLPAEKNLN